MCACVYPGLHELHSCLLGSKYTQYSRVCALSQFGGEPFAIACCGAQVLCHTCARTADVTAAAHVHTHLRNAARTVLRDEYCAVVATAAIKCDYVILEEPPLIMSHTDSAASAMTAALKHPLQYTTLFYQRSMPASTATDASAQLLQLKLSQMQCNMFVIDGKAVLFDCICRVNHR